MISSAMPPLIWVPELAKVELVLATSVGLKIFSKLFSAGASAVPSVEGREEGQGVAPICR